VHGHPQPFRCSVNKWVTVKEGRSTLTEYLHQNAPNLQNRQKVAFLYLSFGCFCTPPCFYNSSQIIRKKISTTANEAFTPPVLERHWTQNYPLGIADVPKSDMIDIDEAKITLDQANCRFAKAFIGQHAREAGHYKGDGRLVIAATGGNQDRFHFTNGTTMGVFADPRRTIMMDTLNVHHDPLIAQMIFHEVHRLIHHAPYWPKDGPIEYCFNALKGNLWFHSNVV